MPSAVSRVFAFAALALAAAAAEPARIKLASDPQWPPFSFGEPARLVGLDVDLVRLVERQLGERFERVAVPDWSTALRLARAREIEVLSGVARTPERERDFLFTAPYLRQAFGIITRTEAPFLATLDSLAGRRVAVVPDHAVTERLRVDQPQAHFVVARNTEQALRLVAAGEADAVLTDLMNANHLIKANGLTNLKIAGLAGYHFELRFAVRRDRPELAAALDAAIAALDPAEKQAVVDRWVRVDHSDMLRWEEVRRVLATGTAVLLLVVSAVFWHNHRLRRELLERRRVEAELRAAHTRLEELSRERAQLLGMAAHDLRNPLTGLVLSLDFVDVDNRDARRRVVREMKQLATHVLDLLSDLLDAQALEDGRRRLRPERVCLATLAREAVVEHHRRAVRKMLRLRVEAPDAAELLADAGALRQVLDNLLSNAIKFSPAGRRIDVVVECDERAAKFTVADEGPGIAPASMDRLFTKFARLDARPTAGESSVGLGLAIVRQLVEAMGGRVWCESELGRGTRFIVELPIEGAVDLPAANAGAIAPQTV
ncbi:MAG: transporter substrate-binding domain-containing protein [Opitutae bacterium]|nr:transporter substrate-binding domain-containing protein [Opitutae bacterium]